MESNLFFLIIEGEKKNEKEEERVEGGVTYTI